MTTIKEFLVKHSWFIPIILSIPAGAALFVPGFYGASDDLHIAWLFEMDRALRMGQIPPRFVPDLSYQFGYPLFNFVFPLPFYIAELLHFIGFSLVDSIKGLFFLTIPFSAFFMHLLLKKIMPGLLAAAGAVIYVYTPYRAVDIYTRGAIGEILGFAILPLIALMLVSLQEQKGRSLRWMSIGSLSVAALILTHNITAYMMAPFFAVLFLILLINAKKKIAYLLQTVAVGLSGLLTSSYFWLPAILESSIMKYDTVFNYYDHFPTIKQLITPYWGYGASVAGNYDDLPFFIGYPALVLLSAVILYGGFGLLKKKFQINTSILVGSWALFSIIMAFGVMNYRSDFVWRSVPLLPYFQFPWRFLILITFCVPFLLAFFHKFKYGTYLSLSLIILSIGTMLFNFHPHDFLGRFDAYYLNRYIPYPTASGEYAQTQEEYLRLPKAAKERPSKLYPRVVSNDPTATILVNELNSLDATIQISATQAAVLDYNKYNYPGWVITQDGKQVEVMSGDPFGQIEIAVPAGYHKLTVEFRETTMRFILNLVSLFALCFTLLGFFIKEKIKTK